MGKYINVFKPTLMLWLLFLFSLFSNNTKSFMYDLDFLGCSGTKVVNKNGEEVLLRGINLGGWLIQENWMCPVRGKDSKWSNSQTLDILESRFGRDKAQELIDEYQDNWITEDDIKIISETGCNVIRVPFWYRNFMFDEKGTWITHNHDDNPGFKRLDWVIYQASKYNMYVILDMHGCPGGQSIDQNSGTLNKNSLYTDAVCQDTMELLWVTIADRYKDNPTVAAYDIMNEPAVSWGIFSRSKHKYNPLRSKTHKMVRNVYDKMIKAIRGIDNRHIIVLSFVLVPGSLPDPRDMGWDNVMYQAHYYFPHKKWGKEFSIVFSIYINWVLSYTNKYNIPAYLGEFKYVDEIVLCDEKKLHWTTWAYKGTHGNQGTFFWYYAYKSPGDIQKDSFEEIMLRWGKTLKTKNGFIDSPEVMSKFKKSSAI